MKPLAQLFLCPHLGTYFRCHNSLICPSDKLKNVHFRSLIASLFTFTLSTKSFSMMLLFPMWTREPGYSEPGVSSHIRTRISFLPAALVPT